LVRCPAFAWLLLPPSPPLAFFSTPGKTPASRTVARGLRERRSCIRLLTCCLGITKRRQSPPTFLPAPISQRTAWRAGDSISLPAPPKRTPKLCPPFASIAAIHGRLRWDSHAGAAPDLAAAVCLQAAHAARCCLCERLSSKTASFGSACDLIQTVDFSDSLTDRLSFSFCVMRGGHGEFVFPDAASLPHLTRLTSSFPTSTTWQRWDLCGVRLVEDEARAAGPCLRLQFLLLRPTTKQLHFFLEIPHRVSLMGMFGHTSATTTARELSLPCPCVRCLLHDLQRSQQHGRA
jgi:hypothetical protein